VNDVLPFGREARPSPCVTELYLEAQAQRKRQPYVSLDRDRSTSFRKLYDALAHARGNRQFTLHPVTLETLLANSASQ
jgi:hypothetical protein